MRETSESSSGATSSVSSRVGGRSRARTASSATLTDENDATPTQAQSTHAVHGTSVEPKAFSIPGFEALEAVNGLYQKLKDSQADVDRLLRENQELILEARN